MLQITDIPDAKSKNILFFYCLTFDITRDKKWKKISWKIGLNSLSQIVFYDFEIKTQGQ
jgi:hypothetical protein